MKVANNTDNNHYDIHTMNNLLSYLNKHCKGFLCCCEVFQLQIYSSNWL